MDDWMGGRMAEIGSRTSEIGKKQEGDLRTDVRCQPKTETIKTDVWIVRWRKCITLKAVQERTLGVLHIEET